MTINQITIENFGGIAHLAVSLDEHIHLMETSYVEEMIVILTRLLSVEPQLPVSASWIRDGTRINANVYLSDNFEMSKLLFDANGVSPKYQSDSHILLRALLSKYNALTDIKYHITDKKEKENSLKNMLASDPVVRAAFAEWLSLPTEADIYNKLLDEIAKESPIPVGVNDFDKKLHQLLYKTKNGFPVMPDYTRL